MGPDSGHGYGPGRPPSAGQTHLSHARPGAAGADADEAEIAGEAEIKVLTWSELADTVWLAAVTKDGPVPSSPSRHQRDNRDWPHPGTEGLTPGADPDGGSGELAREETTAQHDPGHSAANRDAGSREPEGAPGPALGPPVVQADRPAVQERLSAITPPLRFGRSAGPEGTRLGSAPVLHDELAIVRALRPVSRKVQSWREEDRVFDEEGTAERAAEDGLWVPVVKPGQVRWLDLTVIVDDSPTMAIWRHTVTALIALLERLAAFGTVQTCLLSHRYAHGDPVPVLRGGTRQAPVRSVAEITRTPGCQLALILTDGSSPVWRSGAMCSLLAGMGRRLPTALIHLLPQHLWHRTGPPLYRARLTTSGPMIPNSQWSVEWPDAWSDPAHYRILAEQAVPVPVLGLGSRWLGWWARLVTGATRGASSLIMAVGEHPGALTMPGSGAPPGDPIPEGISGRNWVNKYRGSASPQAFRLATLLAAVPVNLEVAQLIQAEFVPESDASHLAELLTSGLLQPVRTVPRVSPTGSRADAGGFITFDFDEEVRAALLSGAKRSETAAVIRTAAARAPGWPDAFGHLSEAIGAPDTTLDPEISTTTAPLVAIERIVMRALSGPYLSRAGRLADSLERLLSGQPDALLRSSSLVTTSDRENIMSDTAASSVPTHRAGDMERGGSAAAEGQVIHAPPTAAGAEPSAVPSVTQAAPFGLTAPDERPGEDIPSVWGNVPPRNPNFTGRQQFLDQLSQRLAAGGTTAVLPAALHGMGGIGKTQIAVEYIYRHLADYDLIWWVQAAQPAQIRASLTEMAQRLRLPGGAEANTAVPMVREALRIGKPFGRWLLIFDSAESPDTVRQFFPTNGPGEILITSRNPDWAGIARPLQLEVFKRAESKELLRRRGPEIDDAEADQLGERLGDLPLAIEQAAAWRSETGMPVREYLRLFDQKVAEILDTTAPPDYEVSVAAAWNVSFDELRKRNPAAHQLLQVCAFFSPEPIARSIFSGVRGISISPELDTALRDPMQLGRAIRDINRYGLAKIDHRHDTIQLHRLVQLVLTNRMTPQHRAEMRHGSHTLLANLDPNDPVPTAQWPRYQDILPHAYASGILDCEDRWVSQLVLNLMTFLYYWGDHEESAKLARQAVDKWSASKGEDDPQTLRAATNLGYYLWVLGRYAEAAEVNQRTLELHRRVSGDSSEETLTAQSAVATDLKAKGEFGSARDLSEDVYQKAKGLFGDDDPTTLLTAHRFAVSLRLAGEYQRARLLDEGTYRRRVEVLGYDNAETISTLNGLILDRREAGEYSWAHAEQEKVVERVRALFGDDKAVTLRRRAYLAVARRKDGDHEGALTLSGEVLNGFRLRYGDDDTDTMASAVGHSIDLRHAHDLDASRKLGEQTFDRYRKLLGEHHPHTLAAAVGVAVTLRLGGDAVGARQLDERSLAQLRTSLGPDHPHSIVCAVNLGSDLSALGEHEAATELLRETVERADKVLGADHPTTLAARTNLAIDLRALGHDTEANASFADVITRYRRVLGEAHPATIAVAGGARADCDIDPLPL